MGVLEMDRPSVLEATPPVRTLSREEALILRRQDEGWQIVRFPAGEPRRLSVHRDALWINKRQGLRFPVELLTEPDGTAHAFHEIVVLGPSSLISDEFWGEGSHVATTGEVVGLLDPKTSGDSLRIRLSCGGYYLA